MNWIGDGIGQLLPCFRPGMDLPSLPFGPMFPSVETHDSSSMTTVGETVLHSRLRLSFGSVRPHDLCRPSKHAQVVQSVKMCTFGLVPRQAVPPIP